MLHRTHTWALVAISLLLVLFVLPTATMSAQEPLNWPVRGWQTSTPESQGMDSAKLADLWTSLQKPNPDVKGTLLIHSLLVIRHGQVVMDASAYPFSTDKPHEAFSLTKSVLSALIGIAIDQGYIKSLDQSIWDYFPKDKTKAMDENKAAITLRNLLNHTSGLGIDDAEIAPLAIQDETIVQHILDAPMISVPGKAYKYLDSNAHLASAILQKATKLTSLEFARKNLFGPLGITNVDWATDSEGVNFGGAGLAISAQDIARIGYLYLHGGRWQDQQLTSANWIKQSLNDQLEPLQPHFWEGYSNFWYNGPIGYWANEPEGKNAAYRGYAAIGYAGQILYVIPDLDLMAVTTGDITYGMIFANALVEYLIPSVQSDKSLPANEKANARLQDVIRKSEHLTAVQPNTLPAIAQTISGKTFTLSDNRFGWTSLVLDFNARNEAAMRIDLDGTQYNLPVGLDSSFRVSEQPVVSPNKLIWNHSCPWLIKGSWLEKDSKPVFQMEIWDDFGQDAFMLIFDPTANNIEAQSILWPEEVFSITTNS